MLGRPSPLGRGLAATIVLAASLGACQSYVNLITNPQGSGGTGGAGGGTTTATGAGGGVVIMTTTTSGTGGAVTAGNFDVEPTPLQTITVTAGTMTPTVSYTATLGTTPANANWGLDKGNLGTIAPTPGSVAVFTPSGVAGGLVNITASADAKSATRQVMIKLTSTQNGPNSSTQEATQIVPNTPAGVASLTAGGGVGGVGGEGLGTMVTDPATMTALATPTMTGQGQNLKLLYPYDKTVFPRGILAPLIMWDWTVGDADAVQIQIQSTTGSYSWTGIFGRPAVLTTTGGKFVRMPIPEDVWEMATNTAGGTSDQLNVSVTIAKAGVGYGPITETWTVATALLSGIIYYNSYGTQLAKNYLGAVGGDGSFGGAVLSIHVGDTGPQLVAGASGDQSQCRDCHSVASGGSRLVVQHGDDYSQSSAYDLTPAGAVEHLMPTGADQGFPGMYPDGSIAFDMSGQILTLPTDTTPATPAGLDAVTTIDVGTPMFAPNGALAAFNPFQSDTLTNVSQKLFVMSFDKTTSTFSSPVVVSDDTGQPPDTRPGWPAFFPDSNSVVFHRQTVASTDGSDADKIATRSGARAQIRWTNLTDTQHVTVLNQLNGLTATGTSYLPTFPAGVSMDCDADGNQVGNLTPDHSDDVNMNYEPTVNPVASGGYAWVVFTSRRLYGSVANIPPFCSDPRGVDLVKNTTTKKLWVAAIDLSAAPGTDASHPAFYLPAQELLAGNSRGFWVLDPCRADGASCTSGDQCCDGYCEPNGTNGALVCSNTPPSSNCSGPMDKCTTAADCCDSTDACIGGFCTQVSVTK